MATYADIKERAVYAKRRLQSAREDPIAVADANRFYSEYDRVFSRVRTGEVKIEMNMVELGYVLVYDFLHKIKGWPDQACRAVWEEGRLCVTFFIDDE